MRSFAFVFALQLPAIAAAQAPPPDFVLTESYLRSLADHGGAIFEMPVLLEHHTAKVHPLASDCEMHLAGTPTGVTLADPPSVVVEPPNLCENNPSTDPSWGAVFDNHVIGQNCTASGYPRIFTEHAAGGSDAGANPNHVLEIHPALKIACGASAIDFTSYLKYYEGMRAIKPASADNCVRNTNVSMRYDPAGQRYEFQQDKGQGCGNFAIAEVSFLNNVQAVNGGHSVIARVSLDGQSQATLKLYTLAGTQGDDWLKSAKAGAVGPNRVYVHGMLTYDHFAFVKTMRAKNGTWINPTTWTKVNYPFALVVFGFPQGAPWGENE